MSPRHNLPGPITLGGNGVGIPRPAHIAAAIEFGSIKLVRPDPIPEESREQFEQLTEVKSGIPASDLLMTARTALKVERNLRGEESLPPEALSPKEHKRIAISRANRHAGISPSGLRDLVRHSDLNARNKKTLLFLLKSGIPSKNSESRYRWLCRVALRPRREKLIEANEASAWLNNLVTSPWRLGRTSDL